MNLNILLDQADNMIVLFRVQEKAEYEGCNWGMQIIDGCSLKLCSATHLVASFGVVS